MKKTLSLILVVLLLLSLTACGGGLACDPFPLPEDANYAQGMAKLKEGDWQEAYDLFKLSADPKAAAELEKFVFVPTTVTRKNSKGRDLVYAYTYDERGNLLSYTCKGDESWTAEADHERTYTYDEQNRLLTYIYRYKDESLRAVYTYDEKGNELTYTYYNFSGAKQNGYTKTYDERSNLIKAEYYDHIDAAYNYTEVFTYDEQDRLLTRTHIAYDGEESVRTYAYEADGSYRFFYDYDDHEGGNYTATYWYDSEDRALKKEIRNKTTDEVIESYEYRRDEQGNELYYRSLYDGDETIRTTTYNEQGQVLTTETKENGELYSMTTYTYNETGEPLTNEFFYGDHSWGRTTYSYDEQNRLLSKKTMSNNGWHRRTYTYDEAGNRVKAEKDSPDEDFVCTYTYDAHGNILTCDYNEEDSDGGLYVEQNEAQWVLQYYPDGRPDELDQALVDVTTWFQYAQD